MLSIPSFALLFFGPSISSYAADDYWKIYHLNATLSYPAITPSVTEFKIPYKITNGTLQTINYDAQSVSLLMHVTDAHNGTLEITIPKDLLNAVTSDGKDDRFGILINGVLTDYHEYDNTSCFRTLSIKFNSDSKNIEIPMMSMPRVPVNSYVSDINLIVNKTGTISQQAIIVSGCTDLKLDDKQLIINIMNPQGQTYKTISIVPDLNGSFSTSIPFEGNFSSNSIYTINATYAGHTTTKTVTIPEFPFAVPVMLIGIVSVISFYKMRFKK